VALNNKAFTNDTMTSLDDAANEAFTTGFPPGFAFHNLTVKLLDLRVSVGTTAHSIKIGLIQVRSD